MYDFTYHRPKTLADAVNLLKGKDEARPMSGGMTLIPTLKQRLARPSDVLFASFNNSAVTFGSTEMSLASSAIDRSLRVLSGTREAISSLPPRCIRKVLSETLPISIPYAHLILPMVSQWAQFIYREQPLNLQYG